MSIFGVFLRREQVPRLEHIVDEGEHELMLHPQVDNPGLPLGGGGAAQLAVDLREVVLVPLRDLLVEVSAVVRQQHGPEEVELLAAHVARVAQVLDLLHPLAHAGLHAGHVAHGAGVDHLHAPVRHHRRTGDLHLGSDGPQWGLSTNLLQRRGSNRRARVMLQVSILPKLLIKDFINLSVL